MKHLLTWNHTRTGKPMQRWGNTGALMFQVMMIRQVYPDHPIQCDGKPV